MLSIGLSTSHTKCVGGPFAQVGHSNDTPFYMTYKKLFMFDSFQNLVFFFTFGRLHFFRKLQSLTNRCSDTLLMILNESLNMSHRYYDYVTSFITGTIFVTDMNYRYDFTMIYRYVSPILCHHFDLHFHLLVTYELRYVTSQNMTHTQKGKLFSSSRSIT